MSDKSAQATWPQHLIAQFEALEKLMRSHLDDHQQFLELIRKKREAVRHADLQTITEITERETALIERISKVEQHRTELARRLTLAMDPSAGGAVTITELAESLGDVPVATRLVALAAQLRERALEVRRESSVVRQAADALTRHLSGVLQQVQSALSRARVYSRDGCIEMGRQTDFSVDVKT